MPAKNSLPPADPSSAAAVTLRPVTGRNLYDVLDLKVADSQTLSVAPNSVSLAEACYQRFAWQRAIYADDTLVGYLLLYDNPEKPEYYLWRLMVDERYQGRGFGRSAVEQLIEYVRGRPGAQELTVSYVPGDGSPQPFYSSFGFVDTGEIHDGENLMRLDLTDLAPASPAWPRPLTHVVLFKLKNSSQEVMETVVGRLRGMKGKIPQLLDIEVGVDVQRSPRSYDVALITRFASMADMQAYQVHPEHQAVLDYLGTVQEAVVVVDYELA